MKKDKETFYKEVFSKIYEIEGLLKKIFNEEELKELASLIWQNIGEEFKHNDGDIEQLITRMKLEILIIYFMATCSKKELENFEKPTFFTKEFPELRVHYINHIEKIKGYIDKNGGIKF